MSQPAPFAPSHRVPAGAMPAWPQPDSTVLPVTTLAADIPLEVLQWQDDGWSQVRAKNGWTGWVDGRRLVAVTPSASRPPVEILSLLGGAAVVLGSFLPWFTYRGESASAWDTPLLFLLAGTGADDQVKCGPVFLVMILLVLPVVTRRPLPPWASYALAGLASVAAAMAIAHGVVGTDPPSVGVGVVATLAGGLLLNVAAYAGGAE